MSRLLKVVLLAAVTANGQPSFQGLLQEVDDQSQQAQQAQKQLTAPSTPPEAKPELRRQYQAHTDNIVEIGQKHPQSEPVNREAAKQLDIIGQPQRAAPFADQAVNLARQSGDAKALRDSLMTQAGVRFDLKNYRGVVADADELLKRDPNDQAALRLRSLAANRSVGGGAPAARAGPDAAALRAPQPISSGGAGGTQAAAALLAQAGREAQAVEAAKIIGQAAEQLALDPQAAIGMLDKAVALDPSYAQAYAERARAVLAEGGSAAAAYDDAQRAIQLDPKSAQAYASRAQAAAKLGRPSAEVLADLKAAAGLDPAFGPDYEKALAQYGSAAPGAGTAAGSAPDSWPTRLAQRIRGDSTLATLVAAAAVVVLAWLAFLFWPSERQDRPQ